jgi:hypothetical protein
LHLTKGEIEHDQMSGGSIFGAIGNFLKQHGSTILNGIAGAAKEIIPGSAPIVDAVRGVVKDATGYGVAHKRRSSHLVKGSPEAKAYMAMIRAKKHHPTGGSFLIN